MCIRDSVFVSETGGRAVIKYEKNPEKAVLYKGGKEYKLKRAVSASGAKYEGESALFWEKAGGARIETPSSSGTYKIDRRASVFEDARLRGMIFKALGNEPGWVMEMKPYTVYLSTDYGSKTYKLKTDVKDIMRGINSFEAVSGKERFIITISIRDKGCTDSMKGDEFEAGVEIRAGEKVYSGCGKRLNKL